MRASSSRHRINNQRAIASMSEVCSGNDLATSMLLLCSFTTTGLSSWPRAMLATISARSGPKQATRLSGAIRRMSLTFSDREGLSSLGSVRFGPRVPDPLMSSSSDSPSFPPSRPSLRRGSSSISC